MYHAVANFIYHSVYVTPGRPELLWNCRIRSTIVIIVVK